MEKDYEYIGLFLTKRSKALLNYWLSHKCPEIVYEKYDMEESKDNKCILLTKKKKNIMHSKKKLKERNFTSIGDVI